MATTDTNVPQVIVNKLTSAEYAAATKSPTEFYAVTDEQIGTSDIENGAITPQKASFTTYSSSEQVVGTWIDGKPIYRKVITIQSPSSSNTDYELIDAHLGTLINLWGRFATQDGRQFPIPMFDSSSTYSVMMVDSNNYLRGRMDYGGGSSITSAFCIVEYTKTTD